MTADTSTFKLHQKNVRAIDMEKLLSLPCKDPSSRANMVEAQMFLHDRARYENDLPKRTADGCTTTMVRDDFIEQLLASGSITEIPRSDVKGWVNFFTIVEFFKQRYRPIRETVDINATWAKDTLMKLTFPSKQDICNMVLGGTHHASFDMAAYYDQFAYENGISEFLCFRKNGKFYKTNRLCMGARQSCQIGQMTTLFLMDFPTRRCKIAYAYIDNIIFVGSREDVLHDSREFIRRCAIAGVTLNDADKFAGDGLESIVTDKGDWCGINLDFKNKQVKLIDKTITKLQMSWMNRHQFTYRQFASHVGLCFWTWGILEIPLYSFYSLLKFISTTSKKLQEDETLWDAPCEIFPSAMPALEKWTDICLANAPRKVKPSTDPVWFVCTDASSWGWGYCAFHYATGEIRTFGAQWTAAQLNNLFASQGASKIKHSVYAEPLAIYNALCHLLNKNSPAQLQFAKACDDISAPEMDVRMKIGVATDNSSAQHSMNRGFASRSYDINLAISRLREAFPESKFDFDFSFIPGAINPADGPSRGKVNENANYGNNQNLRRFAGSFLNQQVK